MSIFTILQVKGTIPAWTVADRLRKAREQAGLLMKDVAERSDISPRTIWTLENGKREPKLYEYLAIAVATNVDVEWLKTGKEGPDGPPSNDGLLDLDSNQEPIGSLSGGVLVDFTRNGISRKLDKRAA